MGKDQVDLVDDLSSFSSHLMAFAASLRDPSTLVLKDGDEIGLANGLAGIALLPLALASVFPGQGWLDVARAYFTRIAQKTRQHPLAHPGLYHGCGGIAFALALLVKLDDRYLPAYHSLRSRLVEQVLSWDWYTQPLLAGQQNFELIGGAAGLLRFLLMDVRETVTSPAFEVLLAYLLWISEEPGRWPHQAEQLGGPAKRLYPQGYLDLGMAHGLAGPLAVLALCVLHGLDYPGLKTAIERLATQLIDQQIEVPWGRDWPGVVPFPLDGKACVPTRAAWCYGTPGIARALWLAGRALGDASLCTLARDALASVLHRPTADRKLDELSVCHGLAGLLLICLRFAHDDPLFAPAWLEDALSELTTALSDCWMTMRSQMPPGLLTGSVGGALTLLAAATHQEAVWDQVLLLS